MTTLFRTVALLVLGTLLAGPALAQTIGDGPYRLKTMYAGEDQCLESNDPNNSADHDGGVYMTNCQNVSGQVWYVEREPSGYNRLRTAFRGDGECLESNDPANSTGHSGNAYMDACQDVSGQLWQIEPTRDQFGHVRLKTLYLGADKCLESGRMGNDHRGGGSYMDSCQDVSGQYWQLVPVE